MFKIINSELSQNGTTIYSVVCRGITLWLHNPEEAPARADTLIRLAAEKAGAIALERAWERPGCGSPDSQVAHDDQVAIDALRLLLFTPVTYKGATLPWCHHPAFGEVRQAAYRSAMEREDRAA